MDAATGSQAPAPTGPPISAGVNPDTMYRKATGGAQYGSAPELTPAEAVQMAKWGIDGGWMNQDEAVAYLNGSGLDASSLTAEPRGPHSPARSHEYDFGVVEGSDGVGGSEVRNWLSAAKFPASLGSSMVTEGLKFEKQWSAMNDAGRAEAEASAEATLARIWGNSADQRFSLIGEFLDHMESVDPETTNAIRSSPQIYNPNFLMALANQAESLHHENIQKGRS